MFFIASKVLWFIAQPMSIILLLLILGVMLGALKSRRTALVVHLSVVLVIVVMGYTTLGAVLIQPLENRFPRPSGLPENIGAILVLGGATSSDVSRARDVSELNAAGDRMTEALVLARIYPDAPIIFSGGIGSLTGGAEKEADTARRFFLSQGISTERLILEGEARNTAENASLTESLLADYSGPALLVTSAFHMPRSMGLFRAENIEIIPWPVDYRSTGTETFRFVFGDAAENFSLATTAMREWIGLVAYSATGRISEVLPSP